ncbi:hypothetical protein WJX84_004794 [Apatococcus fuscideae]|uniref:Uncharacterized protein n=1 Tax=Apatococcus fuscideae TaxID=2026836 RepID=A0AAW1SY53_9CHLO
MDVNNRQQQPSLLGKKCRSAHLATACLSLNVFQKHSAARRRLGAQQLLLNDEAAGCCSRQNNSYWHLKLLPTHGISIHIYA